MKKVGYIVLFLVFFFSVCDVKAQRGCCSHHGGVSSSCSSGRIVCNDGSISPSCTCSGESESSYSNSNSYSKVIYGCTDSSAINYNSSATRDDGSCIKRIYGCMDSNALNYNASANTDDGSCITKVLGCMNEDAINYNSKANVVDGSCLFKTQKESYKKIKYKVKYKNSFLRKKGTVIQKGKNGKKKIVKEIITNEQEEIVNEKIIETKTVKKAIPKIVSK